jgi:hypothetical protein
MTLARLLGVSSLLLLGCARGKLPYDDAGESSPFHDGGPHAQHDAGHTPADMDSGTKDAGGDGDGDAPDAHMPMHDAGMQGATDAGSTPDAQMNQDAAGMLPAVVPSTSVGGTGGADFDDTSMLPAKPAVQSVTISTMDRVDRVELVLRSGSVFRHGGPTGNAQTLTLAENEALVSARLCTGTYDSSTRVFFIQINTNQHRELVGGTSTSACTDFTAPAGRQISGFFGRAGDGVDALGFLYTELVTK